MKSLSELIEEKEQSLEVQRTYARPMTKDIVSWIKTKNYINSLPSAYPEFLRNLLDSREFYIRKYKRGKYYFIEFDKYYEKTYRIVLEVRENQDRAVDRVLYSAYAPVDCGNSSYIREIVGKLRREKDEKYF